MFLRYIYNPRQQKILYIELFFLCGIVVENYPVFRMSHLKVDFAELNTPANWFKNYTENRILKQVKEKSFIAGFLDFQALLKYRKRFFMLRLH